MRAAGADVAASGSGAYDELSDEQLLQAYIDAPPPGRGRGGDARGEAFAALVGRYERRVYGICYRYFGNHADAEDAAQDAFVAVARRAGTFAGGSRLSTWMYRVAINACNDIARKRRRRPQTPVEDIVDVAEAVGAAGPDDDAIAGRETELEVQRALLQLDDLSRTLVLLVAVEGLSYQEVGEALDLPIGTIKSRVHRARARLAELLAPVFDPDLGIREFPERQAGVSARAPRGPQLPRPPP